MKDRTRELYDEIEKIDAHFHLNKGRTALLKEAASEGFSAMVTINTEALSMFPKVNEQKEWAVWCHNMTTGNRSREVDRAHQRNSDTVQQSSGSSHSHEPEPEEQAGEKCAELQFVTTFTTESWGEVGWADRAIDQLRSGLEKGAIGVKIWKNIGMELQKPDGSWLMVDDPSFDPIFEWVENEQIPMLAHLGEPKNCWLPLDEMTVTSDRDYFSANKNFHMYRRPDMPSYEEQLSARERRLARHPDLRFIGLHLASLEWSVDKVAAWLDNHPKCGVDLAERVCHLQVQAIREPDKVKSFVETYQDRIIFGTDQIDDGGQSEDEVRRELREKWHREFRFFAESSEQTAWNVEKPFRGLGLEKSILEKLFRINAITYYPRLSER